jgi:hypothetical protein
VIVGWLPGSLVAASTGWLLNVIVGVDISGVLALIVFVVATPAVWWWVTSAEVHGRIVITGGEGD